MRKITPLLHKVPGILVGLIIVFLFFSFTARGFSSTFNLLNLMKDASLLVIVSLGMSICILSGHNNISVGAVMSLCGIVTAILLHTGMNMYFAISLGILTGSAIGAISGYLIAYWKFDYWVVTYAFMGIAQGLALVLSKGNTVPGFERSFRYISDGKILGVFVMIWITIAICGFMIYLSYNSKFGYNIYSIGGSQQSALLSGINVKKNVFAIYVITGALAAVSGIMLAAKSNSASPIGGFGYEFDAIAAVLIGGTTFDGGKGKITGTIMGAMLIRTLRNGLNMIGLSPYWQLFIIGFIVLTIIVIDVTYQARKKTQSMRRVYKYEAA